MRDDGRRRFGLRSDGPVLMVTGRSQGSRSINAAVAGAAAALRAADMQVLHITGPQHVVEPPDGGPGDPPYVVPDVDEMQHAYAAADFAICRSRPMACAELAVVGLPAAYAADLGAGWIETGGPGMAGRPTTLILLLGHRAESGDVGSLAAGSPDVVALPARTRAYGDR